MSAEDERCKLRALRGKRRCFSIFYDVNLTTKSKTVSEFSLVSFGEIPYNLADYMVINTFLQLELVLFQRNLSGSFSAARKDINLQNSKKLPVQTLLFSCFNFRIPPNSMYWKILEDFTEGNSRKSQIKPYKQY